MKNRILILILIFLTGCSGVQPLKSNPPDIYVLGTIHGNMLDQPRNGLHDFLAALHLFRPTLILAEVRPEYPDPTNGTIDGGAEQAIVHAFAKDTEIPVVPVDWFDDHYNIQSAKEDDRMTKVLKNQIEPYLNEFRAVVRKGSFEESQNSKTQNLIRVRYDILAKNGLTSLRDRDEEICKNIQKQAPRLQGERVLIVFGLAHKYYLEDCVRKLGIEPLALTSWYDPKKSRLVVPSKGFKEEALRIFSSAKELLSSRLKKGYYKTDLTNLKDKLLELDLWANKMREL